MFDNFIVSNTPAKKDDVLDQEIETEPHQETDIVEEEVVDIHPVISEPQIIDNTPPTVDIPATPSYSKDELDAAVKLAEEKAYNEGLMAATNEEKQQQKLLLENIQEQLTSIFMELNKKSTDIENSALKFAIELMRKILPTLEKERAEAEVKNFMAQNFANFASQETLSFAFNPDTLSLVADSIGRLAEQNDFEGKIAVHKDSNLGPTDCRIEWKNGGVERKVNDILDKVENLIDSNTQERENGEQS